MSCKFILDTNILNNEPIKRLRDAGIISACKSGRFAFYATPILLNERIFPNFANTGKIHPGAIEAVKLLIDIKWQRLFNSKGEGMFAQELEGKSRADYLFNKNICQYKKTLQDIYNGCKCDDEAKLSISKYADKRIEEKEENKKIITSCRAAVGRAIRDNKISKDFKFPSFLEVYFEFLVIDTIQKKIKFEISKDRVIDYWRKYKDLLCPYFNKYIEGFLFIVWHYSISVKQDPHIDLNAQEDIEHLIYLIGLDGIVSEEKGFMKTACEALYPDKDFLSVDQFIDKLKN